MHAIQQELALFCGFGVLSLSIATWSTMMKSRQYRPSWTMFPKSIWMNGSSGELGEKGCKMQELTLFCGFRVTPWQQINTEWETLNKLLD
jgi:hypothetical protein